MIRRLLRQIGVMTMATFVWQHRGSAVRAVDLARRLPHLLSGGDRAAAVTEAKAIVALDGHVPTSTDIRISGIQDGAVTLRGDLQSRSLDVARQALLDVPDVLDVRTDGGEQPTLDAELAAP
jgi:hypothetical protein